MQGLAAGLCVTDLYSYGALLKPACSSHVKDSDRILCCPSNCFCSLAHCKCLVCLNFHEVLHLHNELHLQKESL